MSNQTTRVPTIHIWLYAFSILGAFLVIPHLVIGSIADWPPQLMTVHACATVGAWIAGIQYDPRRQKVIKKGRKPTKVDREISTLERIYRQGEHER